MGKRQIDVSNIWHNSLLASHQMATDNASLAGRRFNGPPLGYK